VTNCITRGRLAAAFLCLTLVAASCATRARPTTPAGSHSGVPQSIEGLASYYGGDFHGRMTASGVRYDMRSLVAAHPTFPFGTLVLVTNLENGQTVRVRIVDRGPAPQLARDGVILDLSYAAARALGFVRDGRTRVRLDVLRWGP
jgi:peptidoglycan lytic transglycosylase